MERHVSGDAPIGRIFSLCIPFRPLVGLWQSAWIGSALFSMHARRSLRRVEAQRRHDEWNESVDSGQARKEG